MEDESLKIVRKSLIKFWFGWINNLNLKNKLLISFIIIGILPILLSGYYIFSQSYKVLLENSTRSTMEVLQQLDKNIQSKIQATDNILLSIVINEPLISKLNVVQEVNLGKNKREIDQYLRSIIISTKDISSLIIIDENGEIYGREDGYVQGDFEFKKSDYYIKAEENKGTNVWLGNTKSILNFGYAKLPRLVFPSSYVIKSFYPESHYVGTAIISLKESTFADIIKDIYADKPGNIWMLDDKKQLMLSAKPLHENITPDLLNNIKGDKGNFNIKLESIDNLVIYNINLRTGWYTVSAIPIDFLIIDTIKIRSAIFRISFLVIFLCLLISLLITLGITSEFTRLKGVMLKIRNGEFDLRLNSDRKDEIGELSNTFDTMIERINDLIKKNYEQKIRENYAQLKALQSQIAPHFLYNSLDSINWMLIDKDEYEISSIVVALGDLLRYSISNTKDMMPVKEEISQIENYLMIQKVRFESRFTYQIDVEDDLYERLIPKLLIQPIVENSLKHGIEKMSRNGRIEVLGFKTQENTVFQVKDNGTGISPKKLETIFDNSDERNSSKTHLGLSNVNQRIKLTYGPEYGIEITSTLNEETIVKIVLPHDF